MADNFSNRVELFAREVIGRSFDSRYLDFVWTGKGNDFDYAVKTALPPWK